MIEIAVRGLCVSLLRRESEGPPLVLLHGAGANARVWIPLSRELSSFDLVAPSLPGRDASEGEAFERAEDAAAWVDEILIELGGPPAIVLGHSYGGAVALELAARSTRVAGVVLVSSGARLRVHPIVLEAAARALATQTPMPVDFAFAQARAPEESTFGAASEGRASYAEAARLTPPEATLRDWRACDAFDRMGRLDAITVPALIVGGTDDALTPPKYQRYLCEHLPRAQLELIEGAGHMLPFERPRELAARVRAWASGVSP